MDVLRSFHPNFALKAEDRSLSAEREAAALALGTDPAYAAVLAAVSVKFYFTSEYRAATPDLTGAVSETAKSPVHEDFF